MELIIEQLQLPKEIPFNFEQLREELQEQLKFYTGVVYSDDDIKTAKEDRAKLNRFKNSLNDKRIEVEKDYMKPFNEFKAKINELIAMTDEPAREIDKRIKEYEQAKKEEKTKEIEAFFAGIENRPEWLKLAMIWNPKWLNATKSMKSIKDEINLALEGIRGDLETLAGITEFGFEATEEYKRTLDINKALSEGMRLAEIQKRKEAEAKARAEAERQAKVDAVINSPTSQIINAAEAKMEAEQNQMFEQILNSVDEGRPMPSQKQDWVEFRALITFDQGLKLKNFFNENGIRFERIR